MPAFILHYFLGVQSYHKLPEKGLKRIIKQYPRAYALGLQGPDLFFFYFPCYLVKDNIGSIMHEKNTQQFYKNAFAYLESLQDSREKNIVNAYLTGFLGHYTLDRIFHPYVYARTGYQPEKKKKNGKDYYGKHFALETSFDTLALRRIKHISLKKFKKQKKIKLTAMERKAIARFLAFVIGATFQKRVSGLYMEGALLSIYFATAMLHDSTGIKRVWLKKLEMRLIGCPVISPMIAVEGNIEKNKVLNRNHQEWKNPWCIEISSRDSVRDLYDKAYAEYKDLLEKYQKWIICNNFYDKKALLSSIGNFSYHSGLECL